MKISRDSACITKPESCHFPGGKQQAYSLTTHFILLFDCIKTILDKTHKKSVTFDLIMQGKKDKKKLQVWENNLSVHKLHSGFLVHFKRISSSASKITAEAKFFDRCESTQETHKKETFRFTYKNIDTYNKSISVVKQSQQELKVKNKRQLVTTMNYSVHQGKWVVYLENYKVLKQISLHPLPNRLKMLNV